MGVTTLSPVFQKFMLYGLPVITVFFMSTQPAALQLSFLVGSILSFIQAGAFRTPSIRGILGIAPLPAKPPPGPMSGGAAKDKGPLPGTKLNLAPTYTGPDRHLQKGSSIAPPVIEMPPVKEGVLSGAKSEFTGFYKEAKTLVRDKLATEAAGAKGKSKSQVRKENRFEEVRQGELAKEKIERRAAKMRKRK